MRSQEVRLGVSVHGTIPHHERKIRHLDMLQSVRPEVSKHGRRRVNGTFYERIKSDWRIRVGDYRVIYEIDEEVRAVKIMRIRHRREAYR